MGLESRTFQKFHILHIIGNIARRLKLKRVSGLATLFYVLICIIFISLLTVVMINKEIVTSTADAVDDSITTSLLGSAVVNLGEYGRSGEVVIHDYLPDIYIANMNNYDGTAIYVPNGSLLFNSNVTASSEFMVTSVNQDRYLVDARDKFKYLLQQNLELDTLMVPKSDNIYGAILSPTYYDEVTGENRRNTVTIDEYTVVNIYTYKDAEPPYNEHTYTVTYRSYNEGAFFVVEELSGVDKQIQINSSIGSWSGVVPGGRADGVVLESTSVYARLSFYVSLGKDLDGNYITSRQTVDRVISVDEID